MVQISTLKESVCIAGIKSLLPSLALLLAPLFLLGQINATDPLSGVRKLIDEQELGFFYIENDGSSQKTTSVTYDFNSNQFVELSMQSGSTGSLVASSDGNTDFASGSLLNGFGEAMVFGYRNGEGDSGQGVFQVEVQFRENGDQVSTVANGFSVGDLFVEDVFDLRPQVQVAVGDFGPGEEDELFVAYTASDQTLKVQYYRVNASLLPPGNQATIQVVQTDLTSTSSFDFTISNSLVQLVDIAALDLDFDGRDEMIMAYWREDVLQVDVYDVTEQDEIELRYSETVFDSKINYCNPQFDSDFSFDYLTVKVIGGDFVSEFPGEEFVVGMVFNESCCSNNNNQGLYLLPLREESGALIIPPDWCHNDNGDEFYTNRGAFSRDDPNGLSLAAGDLDGDLDDELVMGSISVRVFDLVKGEVGGRNTFTMDQVSTFSPTSNWDTKGAELDNFVAVGNVDRLENDFGNDFRAEIFVGNQSEIDDDFGSLDRQEFNLDIYRYPETGNAGGVDFSNPQLVASLEDIFPKQGNIDIRRFSIGMVDLNGGGFQLGTPTRTTLSAVLNPLLILNAPPTHFDVFGSTSYDVSNLYGSNAPPPNINHFNSEYEEITTDESTFQTQFTSDWAVSTSVSAGFSFGGFELGAKFSKTYGERFSQVEGSSQTISIKERRTALLDDELLAYLVNYDIFEYPVFRLGESEVITNVLVVVPGTIQKTFIGARSPTIQYIVDHQHGNLFSYPTAVNELDPSVGGIYSFSGQEISKNSGFESDFAINWTDATSSGVEEEATTETTVGANVGGAFKGFGLSASVEGTYRTSEVETRTSRYQQDVSMRGFFGQGEQGSIPGNYPYTVTPVTYWDQNGSLVLDYTVSLSNTEFWGAFYNSYDPAFLLLDPFKPEKGFENPDTYNNADRYRTREILFSERPEAGATTTVRARIHNYGFLGTPVGEGVEVCFYYLDPDGTDTLEEIGCQTINAAIQGRLDGLDREIVEVSWSVPQNAGPDTKVVALIDPKNNLPDEVHDYPQGNGISNNIAWTCTFNPICALPENEGKIAPALITSTRERVLVRSGLKIAPNPVKDWTWLMLDGQWKGNLSIQLVNQLGQTVKEWRAFATSGDDRIPFSIDQLKQGVYRLIVTDGKQLGQTSVLIVD